MDPTLPAASVSKVLKAALPSGSQFSKKVKENYTRAASVLVLYISTIAADIAKESQGKRKTVKVSPAHIHQALDELGFSALSPLPSLPGKRRHK